MTIYDFLYLATDEYAKIMIYNLATDEADMLTIKEAMDKYGAYEVYSFDSYIYKNTLCININEGM